MSCTAIPSFLSKSSLAVFAVALAGCVTGGGLDHPIADAPPIRSASFRQSMSGVLGAPFTTGNRITTLNNGAEIFPAMLSAVRSAKRSITFETFVFEKGAVPEKFAEALAERARAGVKVHVIVDAHGSRKSRAYHRQLEDAGVELEKYHPIFWPDPRRYNNRTHRKLLVIDGKVGFIGGVGIADEWKGDARTPEEWRDIHYRVEGPAVAQIQSAFLENWVKTHETLLVGPAYFPPLAPAGNVSGGVFVSSPRRGNTSVIHMFQLAIASSRQSLKIENPYFIPDDELLASLVAAERRGVRVQILLPGRHIDQKAVRRASRKKWDDLLKAGVELYEFQPTMIHTKLLIADGLFVSVGSANLDNRSLRLNDEANLNVLDAGFAAQQTRIFERDLTQATPITLENYRDKSLAETPAAIVQTPAEGQL